MTTPTPNPENGIPAQKRHWWRPWKRCPHPHYPTPVTRFAIPPAYIIRQLNRAYQLGHHAADTTHPTTHDQAEQELETIRQEIHNN